LKFPNPSAYPTLKKCQNALELYSSLHDDHDLKKARQAFINHIGKVFISIIRFQNHSFHTGVQEYPHGIIELYDDVVSRQVCIFE
jgi:hypothetical protein